METFKKEIEENQDFFFDKSYHEYQDDYYNKKYILKDIFINHDNIKCYIPFTFHKSEPVNSLSFFGEPLQIYSNHKLNTNQTLDIWKIFLDKIKIKNPKYNFFFEDIESNFSTEDYRKMNIYQAFKKQDIKLDKEIRDIFSVFKPNLKNEIRKIKKNKKFLARIYDHTNYPDKKILEMKKMHFFVSKKKTRSDKSWSLNEDFIKKKKGFLVEILYNNKPISYSFFANDLYKSIYFSSVTDRNYFKLAGVNHLSLWKAIVYSKYKKLKKLQLGITKYCFNRDKDQITDKDMNIAFFKSRFCGSESFFLSIDEKSKI